MADIFIPTLHSFENGNAYTGSHGLLRFRIVPQVVMSTPKEVDMAASSIEAEYWHGELCYELSEVEEKRTFPMSGQGRTDLKAWIEAQTE